MKAAFHTLGCKVNQYETEAMAEQFRSRGFEVVGEDEAADVYIINTCTVTNVADRKSRQYIRRMKRVAPNAVVAVCGCYSQVKPEELAEMPEVNLVMGNGEKGKLIDYVSEIIEEKGAGMTVSCGSAGEMTDISKATDQSPDSQRPDSCRTTGQRSDNCNATDQRPDNCKAVIRRLPYEKLTEYNDRGIITSMENRTRAYIKIQEGCDRFCSYCLIPFARGHVRSRDPEEIIEEAKALLNQGFKEIILTGINTALYGTEKGFIEKYPEIGTLLPEATGSSAAGDAVPEGSEPPAADEVLPGESEPPAVNEVLPEGAEEAGKTGRSSFDVDASGMEYIISRINSLEGEFRIRLSSLEPTVVNEEYVKRLIRYEKLCPHLHLSIQSGSDHVIELMNRHHSRQEYLGIVEELRRKDPGYGITTDIIVGFPGETEADFEDSLDMVRKVGFAKVHVFQYSKREGTAAYRMGDQVPESVKKERSAILQDVADRAAAGFTDSLRNTVRTVLFEQIVDGELVGYSDNYVKVYCGAGASAYETDPADSESINSLKKVKLLERYKDGMKGEIING